MERSHDLIGSWIIVDKATGRAVVELYDKRNVDRINVDKYIVYTAYEWLATLNNPDKQRTQGGGVMDKRHYYKTAYVKGLNRCCVGLKSYNESSGMFLCIMPFGNERWVHESDLVDFCL